MDTTQEITLHIPHQGNMESITTVDLLYKNQEWYLIHHQTKSPIPFEGSYLITSLVFFDVTYQEFIKLLTAAFDDQSITKEAISNFPFETCILHALNYGFHTTSNGYAFLAMHWLGGDNFPITMDIYVMLIDLAKKGQTKHFNLREIANTIINTESWS